MHWSLPLGQQARQRRSDMLPLPRTQSISSSSNSEGLTQVNYGVRAATRDQTAAQASRGSVEGESPGGAQAQKEAGMICDAV
jgi:hypothetical protein